MPVGPLLAGPLRPVDHLDARRHVGRGDAGHAVIRALVVVQDEMVESDLPQPE